MLAHCIFTGKLINSFYPQLYENEMIKFLECHSSGYIIVITTKSKLYLYE